MLLAQLPVHGPVAAATTTSAGYWRAEIDLDSLQTRAMIATGSIVPEHTQGKDSGRVARYVA